MNRTIVYLVFLVSIIAGLSYYYRDKLNKLENENKILIEENKNLYQKIFLIESSFDKFMEKGNLRTTKRGKSTPKIKKVSSHTEELVKIKKEIVDLDKTMDSIKHTLPNRTGQDLINSLKIKTEI